MAEIDPMVMIATIAETRIGNIVYALRYILYIFMQIVSTTKGYIWLCLLLLEEVFVDQVLGFT